MAQQQEKVEGTGIDADARRPSGDGPVTVVTSPGGVEYEADNWTTANNYLAAGATIKDGYPTGPTMTLNEDAPDALDRAREAEQSDAGSSPRTPSPAPARTSSQPATTTPAAPASS